MIYLLLCILPEARRVGVPFVILCASTLSCVVDAAVYVRTDHNGDDDQSAFKCKQQLLYTSINQAHRTIMARLTKSIYAYLARHSIEISIYKRRVCSFSI